MSDLILKVFLSLTMERNVLFRRPGKPVVIDLPTFLKKKLKN